MKLFYYSFIMAILLLVAACDSSVKEEGESEILQRIRRETGLVLPPNSVLLNFSKPDAAFDPIWLAKVQIPVDSFPLLKADIFSRPSEAATYTGGRAGLTKWWAPSHVVLEKQYMADGNTFVRIVVSDGGGGGYLYIECAIL